MRSIRSSQGTEFTAVSHDGCARRRVETIGLAPHLWGRSTDEITREASGSWPLASSQSRPKSHELGARS